jgi:hypothetical protein
MPRFCAVLLAVTLALFAFAAPATAQGDLDCWQFASWEDVQATYEQILATDGWDWMLLDEDGDGIACECLYYGYECWTPYQ